MQAFLAFLDGVLLGGLVIHWVIVLSERRALHPHERDPHYEPVKRAVVRHLRIHGAANLAHIERLLDMNLPRVTVMRYLDWMESEKLVKLHAHRKGGKLTPTGKGGFYTLV